MVDLADAGVEPSNAAETRSQGNVTHAQICLVNKLLGKVQLARLSHRTWRRPQVSEKQATKVTRADSQAFGERFYTALLQSALTNQAQSPRNCIWSSHPGRSSGRAFRPTTQTGTEPRLRRRGSAWKVTNILLFRWRCRTNRPAIDAAGEHTNKKLAVEARVARQPGSRTNFPIQFHFFSSDDSPDLSKKLDVLGLRSPAVEAAGTIADGAGDAANEGLWVRYRSGDS
jgi:hypothetical protein